MKQCEKDGVTVTYGRRREAKNLANQKQMFTKNIKLPFINKLVSNIENRFADSNILLAFKVFDPNALPDNNGVEEIKTLVKRFGIALPQAASQEWDDFRLYMADHMRETSVEEVVDMLIKGALKVIYPIMSQLAEIYRIIPPHTSDVERDFSQMKLIKMCIRNRMCKKTLNSVLRIIIEGPDLNQFCFEEVIKMWAVTKQRRIKVD